MVIPGGVVATSSRIHDRRWAEQFEFLAKIRRMLLRRRISVGYQPGLPSRCLESVLSVVRFIPVEFAVCRVPFLESTLSGGRFDVCSVGFSEFSGYSRGSFPPLHHTPAGGSSLRGESVEHGDGRRGK